MTQSNPADGGWIGRWSPGIGDPTPIGWITVFMYALGAWQCYRLLTHGNSLPRGRERIFWWLLAVGLVALGVNKQLDLQSALTEIGRMVAINQGWYQKRHEVQVRFIYGLAAFAAIMVVALGLFVRKTPLPTICALGGSVFLLAFVVIRAASFHHFDQFINNQYLGLSMNGILEIGGICIVIACARWRLVIDR